MSKWIVVLGLLGAIAISSIGFAADAPNVVAPDQAAKAPGGLSASEARSNEYFSANSLTMRQRQELGLTIPKMIQAIRDLEKEGQIEKGMDKGVLAALVLEKLSAENHKAYSAPNINIDAILKFIEAILPLIMTFIQLFSYVPSGLAVIACIV